MSNEICLNKLQQQFVDMAIEWFKYSPSKLLELAGYAGTGKSVVIAEILRRLKLSKDEYLPMAYTGQACTIMRKRGLPNARTCHSGLFTPVKSVALDDNGFPIKDKSLNTVIKEWKFVPKSFRDTRIKLIILDEAWMIPKRFKKFIDDTGIKVIATGDPAQLPPIADEPGYLVNSNTFFLTELMRQSADSPIVYLANRARDGLQIEPGLYGNDALVIYDDELDNNMLARANMILCCKNQTRENINSIIRHDILHVNSDYPIFGERLICRKNNWEKEVDGIPLVNGLTGTVISPPNVSNFDGKIFKLDFLPDLLSDPFYDVEVNYKYLNADYKSKELLRNNRYLTGDRFEYAYASTVHLSQGSEYPCGVYIEEYLGPDIQNALNYTAITRFKDKLIYVKHRPKYWTF